MMNPPHDIYAYVIAKPKKNLLLGIAVDTRTGRTLETCILPTKQRVMLALGFGNDEAHAHNKYRQACGAAGYILHWTDRPQSEDALIRMSEKLKQLSTGVRQAIASPLSPEDITKIKLAEGREAAQSAEIARAKADLETIKSKPKGFF